MIYWIAETAASLRYIVDAFGLALFMALVFGCSLCCFAAVVSYAIGKFK